MVKITFFKTLSISILCLIIGFTSIVLSGCVQQNHNIYGGDLNVNEVVAERGDYYIDYINKSLFQLKRKNRWELIIENFNQSVKDVEKLRECVSGKNVSILGDSISTYKGVSSVKKPHYGSTNKDVKRNQTWWQQIIDLCKLNLCVNNSVGGSTVFDSGINRIGQLKVKNAIPDIIFVFLGANDRVVAGDVEEVINNPSKVVNKIDDRHNYSNPSNFSEAYYIMLHKIINRFPLAKIILLTQYKDYVMQYVPIIKKLGEYFGAEIADLSVTELISYNQNDMTYFDGIANCEHPNQKGMDIISNTVIDALKKMYNIK